MRIQQAIVWACLVISCTAARSMGERVNCQTIAAHLQGTGREMRKKYIPSVDHNEAGKTITGRAGCMVTQAGWWSYEFCFGDYIRQFHAENGQIHDEYFIGLSGNALDGESIASEKLVYRGKGSQPISRHIRDLQLNPPLNPRGVQYTYQCSSQLSSSLLTNKQEGAVVYNEYDSGSVCAGTGKHRKATVFYLCDATQQQDGIASRKVAAYFDIAETQPCVYQVFVRGDAICGMMGLQVPSAVALSEGKHSAQETRDNGAAVTSNQHKVVREEKPPAGTLRKSANDLSYETSGPAISADDTFEALPKANEEDLESQDDVAGTGAEGAPLRRPKGTSMYALGIDDPLYFDDSFIMTI